MSRKNRFLGKALTPAQWRHLEKPKADCRPWVFNGELNTLTFPPMGRYEIDLDLINTDVDIVQWILHVVGKEWVSNEVLGGLVRGMAAHLHPKRVGRLQ